MQGGGARDDAANAAASNSPAGGLRYASIFTAIRMISGLHVLVLAAGASTRLGQPKQLVKLGGRPALHIVVSNAVSLAGNAVTVVVGAHAET